MEHLYPPPYSPSDIKQYFTPQEHATHLLDMKISSVWDSIYSRHMIEQHNMRFQSYIYEDMLWFISGLVSANRITHIDEYLYTYRIRRSGSILHNVSTYTQKQHLALCLRAYTNCLQWLIHNHALPLYSTSFYTFITELFYATRGTTYTEYQYCLRFVARHCAHPIYEKLRHKLIKKCISSYTQRIFSIQKERSQKRKTLTILGAKFHFPLKNI